MGGLGFAGDLLGSHELGPWPEGFTARFCCRNCWWTPSCPCAYLPHEEAERRAGLPQDNPEHLTHVEHCRGNALRSSAELVSDLAEVRGATTVAARKSLGTAKGISKTYFVNDPE